MIFNKLKHHKILKHLFFSVIVILLASCTNILSDSPQEQGELSYRLCGIIKSDFELSSRMAMPMFPSSPVYYVEYSKEADWTDESKHIIKTSSDTGVFSNDRKSFNIPLEKGTWVVEVGVKNGTVKQLKDKKTIPLTPENPVANEDFFLTMTQTESGKGSVSLKVVKESYSYNAEEDIPVINFIEVKILCSNGTTINATNNSNVFSASDVPSGQQRIQINAYDSSNSTGTLIFSEIQEIYIYDGLTTNQWVFDGVVQSGDNNKYQITKAKVKDFLPRQYFVDSRENIGNDGNSGTTKDSPFKTISKAIDVISHRSEDFMFTIHVKNGFSETINETITLTKSVRIECWKETPNDMLGKATLKVYGTDYGIIIGTVGDDEEHSIRTQLYLVALGEGNGLTLDGDGNDGDCGAVQINNGTFVIDGGKITGYNMNTSVDGAVCLASVPSEKSWVERIFIMKKGEISGNSGCHAGAVYVGSDTLFQMDGGTIINNISGSDYAAVFNNGDMSASGLVVIAGNKREDDSNANLWLPQSTAQDNTSGKLNVLNINGALEQSSNIGISPVFSFFYSPSSAKPIAITNNYTDTFSPSKVFKYDGAESDGLVITKSRNQVNFGEAAFTKGGGVFYRADDFIFAFELKDSDNAETAHDVTSVKKNEEKAVFVIPTIKRKENGGNPSNLYYKSEDCGVYEDAGFTEPTSVQENAEGDYVVVPLIWPAQPELCMDGVPLPDGYQPQVKTGDPANKFTIPELPYTGNYTLSVSVNYLGFEYSASFNLTCIN